MGGQVAPREPSYWEFALIDYDTAQYVPEEWRYLLDWRRVYKTAEFARRRYRKDYRSKMLDMPAVVVARRPGDPVSAHVVQDPFALMESRDVNGKRYYHNVDFPRRRKR